MSVQAYDPVGGVGEGWGTTDWLVVRTRHPKGRAARSEAEHSASSATRGSLPWNDPRSFKNCKEPFGSTHKAQETANTCLICTSATLGVPGSSPKRRWLRAALWSPTAAARAKRRPRPTGERRERGACRDSWGARARSDSNSAHLPARGWGRRGTRTRPASAGGLAPTQGKGRAPGPGARDPGRGLCRGSDAESRRGGGGTDLQVTACWSPVG